MLSLKLKLLQYIGQDCSGKPLFTMLADNLPLKNKNMISPKSLKLLKSSIPKGIIDVAARSRQNAYEQLL